MYYVRAGATGSGNGSDWNNAYTSLPGTLQRGATYYVAGGSYPRYTFSTPESGTSVVTVKKASASNHGTDVGWSASYGTSQAVFSTAFNISRGYFVIDGQYRNENNWFDGAAYGFKIQHTGNWKNMEIRDPGTARTVPNITVKYMYIAGVVGDLPDGATANPIDTETYSSSIRNVNYVFSRLFVEGGQGPFFIRTLVSPIVEYCATSKTSGDSAHHGEVVNLFWSSPGVAVVRYNHFRDSYNGASGYPAGGGTGVIAISQTTGVEIYGNIFENYAVGDGAIAAGWANSNIKVYNNTFINGGSGGAIIRFPVAGNEASGNFGYNNLAVNCVNSGYNGQGTFGNNYTDSTSVFVSFAGRDFRLARATQSGVALGSPYNVDKSGITRGADGLWDVGAYEYQAGGGTLAVNAGIDLSATFPNSVTLVGSYNNQLGGLVTLGWSKVSGPGTVSFSSANAATTMATFSTAGTYVLRLTASVLAVSVSDDVVVTVQNAGDTTSPAITLTGPASGAVVSDAVTLTATASDNVGVAGVRFFVSGYNVSDDTAAPYTHSWDSRWVANGSYSIWAQARDAAGNVAWSRTNNVTVNNAGGALPAPEAYWSFDEGTGSTATDAITGNRFTLRNGASWVSAGRSGSGLLLDGIDDRADAPNSAALDIQEAAITVSAWVKLDSQNDWQQILSKVRQTGAMSAPYAAWHLFGRHASTTEWCPQFQILTSSGNNVNVSSTVNVPYGQWVHITGVYDGAAVRIYVNGVEQGSQPQSGTIVSYSQPLYIGASGLPDEFVKGTIDEVRIYSGALAPAQVQTLFGTAPASDQPQPPTGLRIIL